MAVLAAVPLVAFNLWSASEYVGDQMLGRWQLQEQRLTSDQQLAEMSNAEVMRSKREAEATLWKAWAAMRDLGEKARIDKQGDSQRDARPESGDRGWHGGGTRQLDQSALGVGKEAIEGVTPMAVPVLMQIVELMFSFLGFSAWPRKQPSELLGEFNRIQPEFSVDMARRDIVQLRACEELDGMRLSKADFAKRWGVPKSTAWNWLQRFKSEGLIDFEATGMRNVTAIRAPRS
jgi:hypothetical protein